MRIGFYSARVLQGNMRGFNSTHSSNLVLTCILKLKLLNYK